MIKTIPPSSPILKKYIDCFYIYEGKPNSSFKYVAFPHFNTGLSFFKGASVHRQNWSFKSGGEIVVVDFSSNIVSVTSESKKNYVGTLFSSHDENNVNSYIGEVIPAVRQFLSTKENSRQSSNQDIINNLKSNYYKIELDRKIIEKISINQSTIEKNLIPNFIKIYQYYESQVKIQNMFLENINDLNFHTSHSSQITYTIESLSVYSATVKLLEISIVKMLDYYFENNLIEFYTIYNKFEEMGLFMSAGEKTIINNLIDINENMGLILSGIEKLSDNMYSLSQSLNDVNDNLVAQNCISVINTFQLYRLNNKLD